MKKLILMALAIVAFVISCNKESKVPSITNEKNQVTISFAYEESTQTRAFFGEVSTAEKWEKHLSSVTIYAFKSSGEILVMRTFTPSELDEKEAIFALPDAKEGIEYEFYAVANIGISDINSKADLLAEIENSNGYNGEFTEINSSSKRLSGFVMSGMSLKSISQSSRTEVPITLKRTVAKIAIETSVSPDFSNKYSGMVRVNSASLSRSATNSNVVSQPIKEMGTMNFSHLQTSNVISNMYQNLFYIFENDTLIGDNKVIVELDATYDKDGDFETTSDQVPITYYVKLDGNKNGDIVRNGYYRIQVNIIGLMGSETSVSLTVAEWETTQTQTINVGK